MPAGQVRSRVFLVHGYTGHTQYNSQTYVQHDYVSILSNLTSLFALCVCAE